MAKTKDLNYGIKIENGQFIKGIREVNAEMVDTIRQSAAMKAALKDIGVGLGSLAAAGMGAAAMRAPLRAAATMQQSLLGVKAELIGASKSLQDINRELSAVQKNAMNVSSVTAFSAAEIVDLQKELLKGGASLAQIAGKNGAAMAAAQLAQYEGVMASYAGQGLIAIATPFQLAGDQFSYLADQITRASAASTGGFTDFAEGAKYAAPQLSAMGVAIEDMLTMQAMLAQSGLQGSMGGTSLAALYSEASRSGNFTSDTLKSPQALIAQLRAATYGKDEVGAQNALRELGFGDRSMKAVLSLVNQDFARMSSEMGKAASLADKIEITMSSLNAQMSSLASTGSSLAALTFEPMLTPITSLVSGLNAAGSALGKLVSEYPQLAKFASASAAIGIGSAGAYGAARTARGVLAAGGSLRSVAGAMGGGFLNSGIGGMLRGVSQGKALEAAAGIQPVYVTNQVDEKKIALAAAGSDMAGLGGVAGKLSGLMRIIPMLGAIGMGIGALTTIVSMVRQSNDEGKANETMLQNSIGYQMWLYNSEKGLSDTYTATTPFGTKEVQRVRASKLTPEEAAIFAAAPLSMRETIDAHNKESGSMAIPRSLSAEFFRDYSKQGDSLWSDMANQQKYADFWPLFGQNKDTNINLNIDMKQEQTPQGILNKEFIISVAKGEKVKTSAIRGENLKSISRNV